MNRRSLLYHELAQPLADGRPIRLQFAVATKLKNPEIQKYDVEADPQQIERMKGIVERVWGAIEGRMSTLRRPRPGFIYKYIQSDVLGHLLSSSPGVSKQPDGADPQQD